MAASIATSSITWARVRAGHASCGHEPRQAQAKLRAITESLQDRREQDEPFLQIGDPDEVTKLLSGIGYGRQRI